MGYNIIGRTNITFKITKNLYTQNIAIFIHKYIFRYMICFSINSRHNNQIYLNIPYVMYVCLYSFNIIKCYIGRYSRYNICLYIAHIKRLILILYK